MTDDLTRITVEDSLAMSARGILAAAKGKSEAEALKIIYGVLAMTYSFGQQSPIKVAQGEHHAVFPV